MWQRVVSCHGARIWTGTRGRTWPWVGEWMGRERGGEEGEGKGRQGGGGGGDRQVGRRGKG